MEQKTNSRPNILLEILSSWTAVTDGPSDDALPDVVTLKQTNEVKWAWKKARDSVHAALAILTSELALHLGAPYDSRLGRMLL